MFGVMFVYQQGVFVIIILWREIGILLGDDGVLSCDNNSSDIQVIDQV